MTSDVMDPPRAATYRGRMTDLAAPAPLRVGTLLRDWRQRRRLSQLELALDANVSTRHLSFVETGRSRPSAEMVLHLAEQLDVPLRDRNRLLLAAGYAPTFRERSLDAPELAPVRDALDRLLRSHEPYPALVVDRAWSILAGNRALALLTEGVAPELLEPPANALRIALHPDGMAPRVLNLAEWRAHLLARVDRAIALTGDEPLAAVREELLDYPAPPEQPETHDDGIVVPLRLRHGDRELTFLSMMATFGTAVDVTVSELAIESFYPADEATAEALRSAPTSGAQPQPDGA